MLHGVQQQVVRSVPCVQHMSCQTLRISKPFRPVHPRTEKRRITTRQRAVVHTSASTRKVEIVLEAEEVGCKTDAS